MDSNDAPLYHIKISEACRLLNRPFKTNVRVTGQLEKFDQINKTGILTSNDYESFNQSKKNEIKVSFSMIDNFNINEYNARFDLLQVGGYLKSISNRNTNDLLDFQVVYYRILRKTSIKSYYEVIDLQRSYLRKNGYLKEGDVFF